MLAIVAGTRYYRVRVLGYPPGEVDGAAKGAVSGLIVREAGTEDIGTLAHLMTELGYPSSTEDMGRRFEEISGDPSYATLVAEGDGKVLGMVALHVERSYGKDRPNARIIAFVVDSEHRDRGVGRVLISAAEDWARLQGARDIRLTTHKRRARAHEFYRRMGYEATGFRFHKEL